MLFIIWPEFFEFKQAKNERQVVTFFGSLWGDKFLVVKKFFEEGWIFFHFKAGTPYGKIAKIGCEAGGGGVGGGGGGFNPT